MTDNPKGTTKIVINGQEIGPEAVPEFLRKFVDDANKNGIPDMMEHLLNNPMIKAVLGKAGTQLQNLTPEQRAKIEQLMTKLGGAVSSSSSSAPVRFNPTSNTPQIDYKKLGIEDPDKKSSLPSLLIAALLGGLIVLGVLMFLKH